jgi:hypothetical protein
LLQEQHIPPLSVQRLPEKAQQAKATLEIIRHGLMVLRHIQQQAAVVAAIQTPVALRVALAVAQAVAAAVKQVVQELQAKAILVVANLALHRAAAVALVLLVPRV